MLCAAVLLARIKKTIVTMIEYKMFLFQVTVKLVRRCIYFQNSFVTMHINNNVFV